jgi:hypothetical protein
LFREAYNVTQETKELTPEQKKEQQALEARESEQAFAAGFKQVSGEEPTDKGKKGDGKGDETPAATDAEATAGQPAAESDEDKRAREDAEAKARQEAEAKVAAEKVWDGVSPVVRERLTALETASQRSAEESAKRLRNIEGHIGGLNSKLDTALATAKAAAEKDAGTGAAPSDTQVQQALSDPDAWKRLKEDFPDWAGPVEKEFSALRAELAKAKPAAVDVEGITKAVEGKVSGAFARGLDTAEERAYIRLKHPSWRETVKTTDFREWLGAQPDDVKQLAASDSGNDAVKMLDKFDDHRKVKAKEADDRAKQQKRLEGAITPSGSGTPPDTGISDEEAFSRGFNSAKGR